ncbi:MAG: MMPL family transporter [Oleibacter sp.]|nr:MMPL family transporter [Thalassolituus sp.]
MKLLVEKWVTERPWIVILLLLVLTFSAAFGASKLYFRGDYKIFFEEGYGPLNDFLEMQKVFNKSDNIGVLIIPESGEVISEETLNLIREYTDKAWQTPYSSRVDSITNFQHTWSEDDDMVVEDLVSDFTDTSSLAALDTIKQIILAEPALKDRLMSTDADATLINITLQLPSVTDNTKHAAEVYSYVTELSRAFAESHPELSFYHTGVIPINHNFATQGQKDMSTLIPAMLLLIVVLLAVLLRSIWATLATLLLLIITISATMGLAGWAGFFLSTGTINVPIVVLTIAVADCVHIIASMQYAQRLGKSRKDAVKFSLDLNWMPVFITSATTAVGFLTLTLSESPVFADFGILCAVGVILAWLLSVTLFPAMLSVLPIKPSKGSSADSPMMNALADFVVNKQKPLLIFGSVIVLCLSSLSLLNKVDDVSTEYFAKSTEFRQSVDKQSEVLSGTQTIEWAIYTDEAGGVSNPQVIKTVQDFTQWLDQQPEVDHVTSLSDTFKRLNKNMHGDSDEWYVIPEERELAAQYLLLYEMSLPYGLDLNNQINIDKSALRFTSVVKNFGSQEYVALETRGHAWMKENAPDLRLTSASPGLMFAHIGETNMKSMILSMFLALFIISGILVFALKSLRLGIISLFPNITPALVGFGFWALISGEINLGLSIVASMTLGIIVDDTVHFLSKYQRARNDGMNAEEAVRYSFASVGRALVITTIVLALGFSILAFSAFRLNSDMGLVTAMVIVIALIIDFILLPPMLLWLDKDKDKDKKQNSNIVSNPTEQPS